MSLLAQTIDLVPLNFTKILITWNHEMPGAWFHVKITWFHVIFIPWSREIPKIRPFHVKSRDHEITWRGTTSDMDHSPIAIFFEILPSYPSHLEFQIWQHCVEGHFAWWVAQYTYGSDHRKCQQTWGALETSSAIGLLMRTYYTIFTFFHTREESFGTFWKVTLS